MSQGEMTDMARDDTLAWDDDYELSPDEIAERKYELAHPQPDQDQARTIRLMLMSWRGERVASRWERAVFLALRNRNVVGDDEELTDAEKALLDFIADEAVRKVAAKLAAEEPSWST